MATQKTILHCMNTVTAYESFPLSGSVSARASFAGVVFEYRLKAPGRRSARWENTVTNTAAPADVASALSAEGARRYAASCV